jgi:DNA repair exonuclease SbcCD nuclease subunit
MKILFFSDLHAHNFTQFATTLPGGRNSRLQATLNVVEEITGFCNEKDVDVVFFLGDVFHARTKIDSDVYSATWHAFRKLSEVVDELFILVGNHDQYSKDGRLHSLEPFKAFAKVIDRPVIERVITTNDEEFTFAAHPFTTDIDRWKRFTKIIPKVDFFLFHQGVSEAVVGAFDISIKAEVGLEDFPREKGDYCLGGHYHKSQWLTEGPKKKGVAFIGSPLQHNFGERNDGLKGWWLFDDKLSNSLSGRWGHIGSYSTNAPKFRLYESAEAFEEDAKHATEGGMVAEAVEAWNNELANNYIRVRCSPQEGEQLLKVWPSLQIETKKDKVTEEHRVEEAALSSDEALLRAYIEQVKSGLDEERLLKMGMEMLMGAEE